MTDASISKQHTEFRLLGQNRIRLLAIFFSVFFFAIAAKLTYIVVSQPTNIETKAIASKETPPPRPDIVDRNGMLLATDIAVASLYADPRKIYDIDEAVEALTAVIPELDAAKLRSRLLQPGKAFVWLKRQVSTELRDEVYNLGIPGVGYVNERRRVYPMGRLAAHVVGNVDVDTKGIAGIEKFIDEQGALFTASLPDESRSIASAAQLSLDGRVQHIVQEEMRKAIRTFGAVAGGAIVMDIQSGEIIAMVSMPDFDPNSVDKKITNNQQNKMTSGVYELGSVVKAVTFAMAFELGIVNMGTRIDARLPLVIGRARINDFHATRKVLTVPEVFTNSSNIATAKMALAAGIDRHKAFLQKMGLLERMTTELPESAQPLLPRRWGKLVSATAAFGHGFAVQPLQGLAVVAGLLNDGVFVQPTLLKRPTADAKLFSKRLVSSATSAKLRYLFRLNALKGSASKADMVGYQVGGKTGTAEKVINGRYSKDHRLASFIGAFPMNRPRYAIIVMLDEPKPTKNTFGFATAGWNAAPTTGTIIERIAPLLGVTPKYTKEDKDKLESQYKKKVHG
jgi:cell division protein FtsI (penicillin-binding protein 3)